ncbi:MAG: hypothetical protein ACHQD8_05230 [Chitinophagales bacterium]
MSVTFVLAVIFIIIGGCKKPGNNSVTGGGKGGNVVIRVTPVIYSYYVDTCTVYIKYGTHDAPVNGVYDDSAVCVLIDTIPVATFPGLTVGIYYLYGIGYHSTGGHPPNVKGSQICTIEREDTTHLSLPTFPYLP